MMSDFRGGEGSKKTRFYKVKIGLRAGGGVKNDSKKSDIIYESSLSAMQNLHISKEIKEFEKKNYIFI